VPPVCPLSPSAKEEGTTPLTNRTNTSKFLNNIRMGLKKIEGQKFSPTFLANEIVEGGN